MELPARRGPQNAPDSRTPLRKALAFAATLGMALADLGIGEVDDQLRLRRSLKTFDDSKHVKRKAVDSERPSPTSGRKVSAVKEGQELLVKDLLEKEEAQRSREEEEVGSAGDKAGARKNKADVDAGLQRLERELRYANFGTSHSWGAGLKDRRQAYPFLLSHDVKNLALRATGPLYPSLCTASMLGEDVVDVITIEFFANDPSSTHRLALRLRQRFPDVIIIFLVHFYPMMIKYKSDDGGSFMNLQAWAKQNAPGISRGSPDFVDRMEKETEGTFFFPPDLERSIKALQSISGEVGGFVVNLANLESPTENIQQQWDFTGDDWHHPSPKAHHHYASHIKGIVDHAIKTYPLNPRVQRWEHEDNCQSWFETGVYDHLLHGMTMEEFSTGKHALNVEESGGSLSVTNPSDHPLTLMVSFMVTGPSPSIYPKTRVSIGEDDSNSVIIDPVTTEWGEKKVHVSENQLIGLVQPGTSVISFAPLERTEKPFRVVGTLIIPDAPTQQK